MANNKERVKKLRELYGFTQEEFAELYGLSVRTVQSWEADGNTRQPKDSLIDLMEFYYLNQGYKLKK